jgi:N utilization substance protein B
VLKNRPKRLERIKVIFALYQRELNDKYECELKDYALKTYNNIILHLNEIDSIISANLFDYDIIVLNKLDKQIIRLSTFEMKYLKTYPVVSINEALEITKEYTELDDLKQHKFTNKLLNNIKEYINNDK